MRVLALSNGLNASARVLALSKVLGESFATATATPNYDHVLLLTTATAAATATHSRNAHIRIWRTHC